MQLLPCRFLHWQSAALQKSRHVLLLNLREPLRRILAAQREIGFHTAGEPFKLKIEPPHHVERIQSSFDIDDPTHLSAENLSRRERIGNHGPADPYQIQLSSFESRDHTGNSSEIACYQHGSFPDI